MKNEAHGQEVWALSVGSPNVIPLSRETFCPAALPSVTFAGNMKPAHTQLLSAQGVGSQPHLAGSRWRKQLIN